MTKKRANPKRPARQAPPPQTQQQGVAELTDADLEQVQGGSLNIKSPIKGEATDVAHEKEIDVLSYSWK